MLKVKGENEYSWEERYRHVFKCYCSLWNSSLNFITDNYGSEALDKYLRESMNKNVLGRSTFPDLSAGNEVGAFLKAYIGHHEMLGSSAKVIKAEKDEIIVEIAPCGSKSMLIEEFGAEKASHYCRHCEVLPMWEEFGWYSAVDKSSAKEIDGENTGCRRIFKPMKR